MNRRSFRVYNNTFSQSKLNNLNYPSNFPNIFDRTVFTIYRSMGISCLLLFDWEFSLYRLLGDERYPDLINLMYFNMGISLFLFIRDHFLSKKYSVRFYKT